MIVVDGGDFIARSDRPSEKSTIQLKIAAEFMLWGMDVIGYSACNVGEGDLIFGDGFLREKASSVSFPLISGSFIRWPGPERPFQSFAIASAGGIRVAIVGIVSDKFSGYVADHSDPGRIPSMMPSIAVALENLMELETRDVDLKILLAHLPYDEAISLLRTVPGFDIAILAHTPGEPIIPDPQIVEGTRLVQVGWDGKVIGRLDLHLDGDGRIVNVLGSATVLDGTWPDHPAMTALHDEYLARVAAAIEEILAEYPVKPPPSGGRYVGSGACLPCHDAEWQSWRKTKHPLGLQTLVDRRREYDPECFSCHTTGFAFEGGFRLITETPLMGGVQCESCHGAGDDHCKSPNDPYNRPDETTCRSCHLPLHSPEFDYPTYRAQILHPAVSGAR